MLYYLLFELHSTRQKCDVCDVFIDVSAPSGPCNIKQGYRGIELCSYLSKVDYFNRFVKKEFVECMSLTFSSALLFYPTELKTESLYNAVHWLSHRSGKVILQYLMVPLIK